MWAANLLSTDSHTQSWQVLQRMCFNGPLGILKLPSKHLSLNLPHRNSFNCIYSQSHPLSQSASPYPWGYHLCCRSLLSTEGYNDTVWKMDLVQKIKSILSSSAEGVVSLQVSPLNLSTKFIQFSYFQLRRANLFS